MNLKTLIVFFLLIAPAYAENWVCVDKGTGEILQSVRGDCLSLGICTGLDNTGIKKDCFEATEVEYNNSKIYGYKYVNDVIGKRIIELTQSEKDAIEQQKQ